MKNVSYIELYDLFIEEVSKIDNLHQFCIDNQLEKQYTLIVKLKNRTVHKKFTIIITNVLEKLGYTVEGVHLFEVLPRLDK